MKEIRLNAFAMNTVGHQSPGLWAHPRDRSTDYTDLDYWIGLARTLERGLFGRIFADPEKIRRVRHEEQFYKVDAIHLCEPSPQRTPVLYQAGASSRGRAFAAAHAECVFINGPSPQVVGALVRDLRRRAAANGRDPADLLIFTLATVI